MNIFPTGTWVPITFSASGDTPVVAAGGAGKVTQVLALIITVAGATTITAKQGSTALTGAMSLATGVPLNLPFTGVPYFTTAANAAFILNSSNAVQVSGMALVLTA